ncbi:MAG: hypothetical protein WCS87_16665 [Methylococcaceae bacterium]
MPAMKTLKISIAAKISRAWPAPIGVIVLNLMAVKLQLGNADLEAPASSLAKLELRLRGSQAGAWEPEEIALCVYSAIQIETQ